MDTPLFDDSLKTGNATIDEQHRWLFALSARVAEKIGACSLEPEGDAGCEDAVEDAVTDAVYGLVDYIAEHFGDEERLMASAGYPLKGVHAALHEELSAHVGTYMLRFANGDDVAATDLTEFFNQWLTSHIMVHDRQFTAWLSAAAKE